MHNAKYAGHGDGDETIGRGGRVLEDYKMRRGIVFGGMIIAAMLAFELFNYTTTDYALTNLIGDLRFLGLRWATILSIAFCGIDFAGIARLFTPAGERGERVEVWYLLGAWFLAATMNAMLTWWGVSLALLSHPGLGNEILGRDVLLSAVPVFVAILVWLIRILLIGLLSMAGDKLFNHMEEAVRQLDEAAPVRPAAARLPTAGMAGTSRPARVIGAQADEPERPRTVAEKHGYGRFAQSSRTAAPPPPPAAAIRPVPKPVGNAAYNGGNNRPAAVRAGNGNGNGHSQQRYYDDDFDS